MKHLIVLCALVFLSCKKDSLGNESKLNNTTVSQSTVKIDGQFKVIRRNFMNAFTEIYTAAEFNNATGIYSLDTFSVNVGNVKLNNISMLEYLDLNINSYLDTTKQLPSLPVLIDVSGQGTFPQTQIQGSVGSFPVFTESLLIPDSVQLANGFSINFTNILNSDSVFVYITRVVNWYEKFYKSFPVNGNSCTVTILPSDIAFLNNSPHADIYIYSTKTEYKTVNNLNFKMKYYDGHFKQMILH